MTMLTVYASVMFPFLFPTLAAVLSTAPQAAYVNPLTSTKGLAAYGAALDSAVYRGRRSVRLRLAKRANDGALAVLSGLDFKDGTIDFDIVGMPMPHAEPDVRGFVGIAFHTSDDHKKFECFYLRMTNARSTDQERRNHTVQYCSVPDYGWERLRKEKPFRYEAYTDLQTGAWTHVHITIAGTEARFYVGPSKQPCLVVHDLILGPTHGKFALWVGDESQAYYSNLRVSKS